MTDPFANTAPIPKHRAMTEQAASGQDSQDEGSQDQGGQDDGQDEDSQDQGDQDEGGQDQSGRHHATREQKWRQEPMPAEPPRDWAWVEEWRGGREPVPWGPGLALALFTGLLVATAVYVLSSGLADRPLIAVAVNVVVAAGLGPALWLSRRLPVLRWIAGGAVLGVVVAWLSVLVFLV